MKFKKILFIAFSLTLFSTSLFAEDFQLLLGLRKSKPAEKECIGIPGMKIFYPSSYRTLWIRNSNPEKIEISTKDKIILVPRQTSFWKVGADHYVKKTKKLSLDTEQIWVRPSEKASSLKKSKDENDSAGLEEIDTKEQISFIGSDWISTQSSDHSLGGTNLYNSFYSVQNLDDLYQNKSLEKEKSHLEIEKFKKEIDKKFSEKQQCNSIMAWSIVRNQGSWTNFASCGICNEYDSEGESGPLNTGLALSSSQSGNIRSNPISWKDLKSKFPKLQDAFTSPQGEYMGIISDSTLEFYHLDKSMLGEKIASIRLQAHEIPVMIQFATESNQNIWKEKLPALMNH